MSSPRPVGRPKSSRALAFTVLAVAGCSGAMVAPDAGDEHDAGGDGGLDAGDDGGLDAGSDAGFDGGIADAGADAGALDAGTDGGTKCAVGCIPKTDPDGGLICICA